MTIGLTKVQAELLDFIIQYEHKHGIMPTYDDMRTVAGESKGGIHRKIGCLVERGHLTKLYGKARGLQICSKLDEHIMFIMLQRGHAEILKRYAAHHGATPTAVVHDLVAGLETFGNMNSEKTERVKA